MHESATPASRQLFEYFVAKFPLLTTGSHPASDGGEYVFQLVVGADLEIRGVSADPWQLDPNQASQIQSGLQRLDENTLSVIVAGLLKQQSNQHPSD